MTVERMEMFGYIAIDDPNKVSGNLAQQIGICQNFRAHNISLDD